MSVHVHAYHRVRNFGESKAATTPGVAATPMPSCLLMSYLQQPGCQSEELELALLCLTCAGSLLRSDSLPWQNSKSV